MHIRMHMHTCMSGFGSGSWFCAGSCHVCVNMCELLLIIWSILCSHISHFVPKHCLASTSKATILNMAIPIIPTPRYVPAPDHYFLLNSKSTDIDLVMALQHWQFPSAAYPKHGFILQDIPKHGQLRFNYSLKKKNHQGVIEVLLLRQAFVVHNDDFKDESFF